MCLGLRNKVKHFMRSELRKEMKHSHSPNACSAKESQADGEQCPQLHAAIEHVEIDTTKIKATFSTKQSLNCKKETY